MNPQECLKKTYVKFEYIPPAKPQPPANCKIVSISKAPEIWFNPDLPGPYTDPLLGVEFHCAVVTTSGAGGVILLLQATGYVVWETGFYSTKNEYVHETHRVRFSLPVMIKLQGPRIALVAISKWPIKLINYVGLIAKTVMQLRELDDVVGMLKLVFKGSFCPEDIDKMVKRLKVMENQLNELLQRAARGSEEGEIARKFERHMHGDGRFAGVLA